MPRKERIERSKSSSSTQTSSRSPWTVSRIEASWRLETPLFAPAVTLSSIRVVLSCRKVTNRFGSVSSATIAMRSILAKKNSHSLWNWPIYWKLQHRSSKQKRQKSISQTRSLSSSALISVARCRVVCVSNSASRLSLLKLTQWRRAILTVRLDSLLLNNRLRSLETVSRSLS